MNRVQHILHAYSYLFVMLKLRLNLGLKAFEMSKFSRVPSFVTSSFSIDPNEPVFVELPTINNISPYVLIIYSIFY